MRLPYAALVLPLLGIGCSPSQPACLASNCNGCCDTSGQCQSGSTLSACGVQGAACIACVTGQACNPTTGACVSQSGDAGCGPASCPGCCSGTSCLGGGSKAACGTNGVTCQTCTGSQFCSAGGCFNTCTGCVADGGFCAGGTSAQQCGSGGASCVACAAQQVCRAGTCQAVDGGGSDSGSPSDAGAADAGPTVGYCKLGGDPVLPAPTVNLKVGDPGVLVYGQVYQQGVTDKTGQGPGVTGQLGYGAVGSDPSTASWTWIAASYDSDTHGGSNDQYKATLPDPGVGQYAFAFRFALNAGPWLYCDAAGSVAPYSPTQAGTLVVSPIGIDWCNLQFPSTVTGDAGTSSGNIYGRVYVARVTDVAGGDAGIFAEVGYGLPDASYLSAAWSWTPATYNLPYPPLNVEYMASFALPAPGAYQYLYRFSYDGGAKVYCDLNGGDGGTPPSAYGALTSN